MLLCIYLPVSQWYVCLEYDALIVVTGSDLHVERFCAFVCELAGNDDLRAIEVVGEKILSDVLDGVLRVVDSYVRQQRSSDFIIEPRKKHKYMKSFS